MPLVSNHNGLRLWHVTESADELCHRAQLNHEQKQTLTRVNTVLRKNLWLCARVIAREMFNDTIDYTPDGAPFLTKRAQHISISHTADMLAFYAADKSCGVDIEKAERDAQRVVSKFSNPLEVDIMRLVYPENPELLIWCIKEALYKMSHIPGAELLHDFQIISAETGEAHCHSFGRVVRVFWQCHGTYLFTYTKDN